MIFIIEGPDKSGKSTLETAISKKFPGIMLKITDRPIDSSEKEREKIKNYYSQVMKFIETYDHRNIILDRFYPSELCYSIKRGYEAMEDKFFKELEDKIRQHDHLLIFCNPGKEIISKRITEEPDEYVSQKENETILERYAVFFKQTSLNKIVVDTSKSTEETIKEIENKINEHKRHHPGQLSLF